MPFSASAHSRGVRQLFAVRVPGRVCHLDSVHESVQVQPLRRHLGVPRHLHVVRQVSSGKPQQIRRFHLKGKPVVKRPDRTLQTLTFQT